MAANKSVLYMNKTDFCQNIPMAIYFPVLPWSRSLIRVTFGTTHTFWRDPMNIIGFDLFVWIELGKGISHEYDTYHFLDTQGSAFFYALLH